ncbi:MAG TPA: alpha/beta hydrolase [Bacteroidia bacterium]|nr:alpha/beta hydrolase [Bacteroidia bacterium]
MRKTFAYFYYPVLLFFFLICSPAVTAQVKYGSNNGSYLTIRNTKIYYETYGTGTPFILLHGGLGSIADFRKCIPELSKKYKVIIPDAPGHGRSELADSALSYQLIADYCSKMIDLLKLDSTYIMGWSDGGIEALLLAKNRPDKVKKIIAVGPNYRADGLKPDEVGDWGPNFSLNKFEKNFTQWITFYNTISPQKDWKRLVTESNRMWFKEEYFPLSDLTKINIPVLIVFGDRDQYKLEHGLEMHRAIKNSQFCVIPNCSHSIFFEKPDLMNQLAIDFLNNK